MSLNKLSMSPTTELVTGTIVALNGAVGSTTDALGYANVAIQVTGAYTGTLSWQVSNDGTNWLSKSMLAPDLSRGTSTTTTGMWSADIGGRYYRVVATAWTSGTANVSIVFSAESSTGLTVTHIGSSITLVANPSTGTTGPAKLEDATAATGDMGIFSLGVRAPTTAVALTSAAGDYSGMLVDSEGKTIISGNGSPENSFQQTQAFTSNTNTSMRAAAGGALRTYITDVAFENTGATANRVFLVDGASTQWTVTVPPATTLLHRFSTPLRGSANTAWGVTLGATGTVTVSITGYLGV